MAYVNLYNPSANINILKSVRLGGFTYFLGYYRSGSSGPNPYLLKVDSNGNFVWQRQYQYPEGSSTGFTWEKPHFTDIMETSTGDLITLVSDSDKCLIVKLDSQGNVIWIKKYYDKNDVSGTWTYISVRARLFLLNSSILLLRVFEKKEQDENDIMIDNILFWTINPQNGTVILTKQLQFDTDPYLRIMDEEVRSEELVMFSYFTGSNCSILKVNASLVITQSVKLSYNGSITGANLMGIYAASPIYDGAYTVLGSFSLSNQTTSYFFLAEISADNESVISARIMDLNFSATHLTVHKNEEGIAFSIDTRLFKLNSALTASVWAKRIWVPELSRALKINKSLGNYFHAYSEQPNFGKFAIALAPLDYSTCRTEDVDSTVLLTNEQFLLSDVTISFISYTPNTYINPVFASMQIDEPIETKLCGPTGPQLDLSESTIVANPITIEANGTSTSVITVTLKDTEGNIISPSSYSVQINTTAGTLVGNVFTNGDGIYTQTLTSSTVQEIATVTFSVISVGTSPNTATVTFTQPGIIIDVADNPLFQSPYLYFQAVGSTGVDSTEGIHLRWTLAGTLGDNHIPKGNYAANNVNFNKPNDFVKIYRTPYQKATFTLDLELLPQAVNDQQKFWLYKFNNDTRIFFVYFRNATKYDQVRATINPMTNPSGFIQAYGNEIIEIENKRELFFASKLVVSNTTPTSSLQAEALSVPENQIFVNKSLFFRKTYSSTQLDNVDLISENGRSVRFKPENCIVLKIEFEFYSDFIVNANSNAAWESLGEYALTLDDELAINQLDPDENNPVKGNWLRFNDEAYVDTDNYVEKWNAPVEAWNRNIKDVVGQYINLSNDPDNPKAVEFFDLNLANDQGGPLTIGSSEDEAGMEISNLDMLLIAGYDYHIARMLGLGTLDLASEVMEGEYIYISEYYTSGSLSNDLSGEVHHLSMSLPTSINTQRLPLPVALSALVPGFSNEEGEDGSANVDENGYSFDGRKRYIQIFPEQLPQGEVNPVFFANAIDFDGSTFTMPIYAGLEYRKVEPGQSDTGVWEKPELSHTKKYLNIDGTSIESYETLPIIIPDYNNPLYTHRQTRSGMYYYSGYGINWFSRATTSDIVLQIETEIKPYNSLLPPTNVNALLIVNESPLMFSSQSEQLKLAQINDADKTFIRLTFDYDANNEIINYQIPIDTAVPDSNFVTDTEVLFPDEDEIFAEDIEIFFRNETPKTIYTKVVSVSQDSSLFLSVLQTESYHQIDGMVPSEFPEGTTSQNFIGSLLVMGNQQYIVNNVIETPNGLRFTVYNQQITNSIMGNEVATIGSQPIMTPTIENDGLCTIVENMQNTSSWGSQTNPHSLKVKIGFDGANSWGVNRELVKFVNDAGLVEKYIEKTRGFWEEATIEKFLEDFTFQNSSGELIEKTNTHRGIYKITFNSFSLSQHVQYNNNDVSVEFFNGTVRLYTENNMISGSLTDSREVFKVFKTENIGTVNNLVLYIHDENFQSDDQGNPSVDNNDILIDNNISVNYYPSYKVYLYHDPVHNLTEEKILPEEGEGVHYSIFGLRAVDYDNTNSDNTFYKSKLSVPAIMFAQEIILPQVPNGPQGVLYATRPDFFGKSTYTFTTQFSHKPYSVGFYRADDQALLSSIYEIETIREIRDALANVGGNQEEYLTDRWQNFLDFDVLSTNGDYLTFPPNLENAYKFPLPNKVKFFDEINFFIQKHNQHYGTSIPIISSSYYGNMTLDSIVMTMPNPNDNLSLLDFVKEAVLNVFVPLNEIPVIYNFIHTEPSYKPTNRKPVIRDDNGYLLNPRDVNSGFEMAPMMKVVSTNKIQFTDFTLDGTTSNLYFYTAKEIGSQMKMSDFSTPLGPIKMVNTNAPEAPKIKSALPVLSNDMLNITSKISFEINAYPLVQNIKKIKLYRTDSRIDAESIYFMTLVKEVDLEADGMETNNIWKFTDDFSDLDEIPFGDTLFYRVTVSREVEYADDENNVVIEYAPSQHSKILATIISESKKPNSPVLNHSFEPIQSYLLKDIVLHWDKMCYKGTYHVYKMNNQGHWVKIHEINTNDENIHLPLEDTNLESSDLSVIDAQGNPVYHHFKVITENTAGMFSTEENVLTIWKDVGGIGEMKISHSFVIR